MGRLLHKYLFFYKHEWPHWQILSELFLYAGSPRKRRSWKWTRHSTFFKNNMSMSEGKASASTQKHERSKNSCFGDRTVKDIRWSGSKQGYASEGLTCHAQGFELHIVGAGSHHTIKSDRACVWYGIWDSLLSPTEWLPAVLYCLMFGPAHCCGG